MRSLSTGPSRPGHDLGAAEDGSEVARRRRRPALLDVGRGEPRHRRVEGPRLQGEVGGDEPGRAVSPRQAPATLLVGGVVRVGAPREGCPGERAHEGEHRPRPERGLPRAEAVGERHRQRGAQRGAAHHREHVEPRDEPGALGREEGLDEARQQRAGEGDADAGEGRAEVEDRPRVGGEAARGAREDGEDRPEHGGHGAEPVRDDARDRGEEAHAEHRQGGEGPGGGVAEAEVGRDRVEQRRHARDRGAQVGGDREQRERHDPRGGQRPRAGAPTAPARAARRGTGRVGTPFRD